MHTHRLRQDSKKMRFASAASHPNLKEIRPHYERATWGYYSGEGSLNEPADLHIAIGLYPELSPMTMAP